MLVTNHKRDIPFAPYYVTALDAAMSGFGPAHGKTLLLVIPCFNDEEAQIVGRNAESTGYLTQVRIRTARPESNPRYLHALVTRDIEPAYFDPNGFDPTPVIWSTPATGAAVDALYGDEKLFFGAIIAAEDRSGFAFREHVRALGIAGEIALDQLLIHFRTMATAVDRGVVNQFRNLGLDSAA